MEQRKRVCANDAGYRGGCKVAGNYRWRTGRAYFVVEEMIILEQYFGAKPHSDAQATNAQCLFTRVNGLLDKACADGAYDYWIDPDTGTQISGAKGGAGDGGFRLPDSATGLKKSNHKDANAVDVYDPDRTLAQWCVSNKSNLALAELWMEDPRWTPVWVHLQTLPPGSDKRIYVQSMTPPLASALDKQNVIPARIRV